MTIRFCPASFNQGRDDVVLLHDRSPMTTTVYETFWPR